MDSTPFVSSCIGKGQQAKVLRSDEGMGPRTSLRPELPEDLEFLYKLYASTRSEEMKLVPWDESQKEAFLRMQFQLQASHYHTYYPDASFDLILLEDVPIGRLYVDRKPDEMLLIDIALAPQHRGAGIGSFLLGTLLSEAAARNVPVRIHVERENPALRLYTRRGFKMIEDKGVYLFMEWKPGSESTQAETA